MTLLLLAWLAAAGPIEDGAQAWEAGDLDQAIATWQSALDDGRGSVVLHDDLGVAWYRKGDRPRAIAHWRMARVLSPRDANAAHNLAVVRAELEGVPRPTLALPPWLQLATVGEYGVLGTVLLLVASVGAWLARLRRWAIGPWLGVGALGVLLGAASLEGVRQLTTHPAAVVLSSDVALRDEPDAAAPAQRRLAPGTELAVERRSGDYVLVSGGDGQRGWVPAASVALIGENLVLPAR